MTYVKLEDAIKTVKAIEVPVGGFDDKIDAWLKAIDIAAGALATLPTVSVTDEMVERAARAMAANRGLDWDRKNNGTEYANHGYWLPCARAALEAALGATVSDGEVLAKFAAEQEPLGAEFEALYDANVEKLYDDDTVSDGWEDIATAPRDGTDILVYCGPAFDPMWAVACWTDDQWDVWYAQGDGPQCWEYWKPLGPLPAPPTIE